MPEPFQIRVGDDHWPLDVPAGALVWRPGPTGDPADVIDAALDAPRGFDGPLSRAFTPDDRVTVALDGRLPVLDELLPRVLSRLSDAGIPPAAVTLLLPPGADTNAVVDAVPDESADVHLETHDPADEQKHAYLATTKGGRRAYLSRPLVEADAVVLVTARRYDPVVGAAGASVFPTFANAEAQADFAGKLSLAVPAAAPEEAGEVLWLLGSRVLVQAIPGAAHRLHAVVAGLADTAAVGARMLAERWRFAVPGPAAVTVAGVAGTSFYDLAAAAVTASRVTEPDGRIVLLAHGSPEIGEAGDVLRNTDDPAAAMKALAKHRPAGWQAAWLWAAVAKRHKLAVAGWSDEQAEELFAARVGSAASVQRLLAAGPALVIPDADNALVELA